MVYKFSNHCLRIYFRIPDIFYELLLPNCCFLVRLPLQRCYTTTAQVDICILVQCNYDKSSRINLKSNINAKNTLTAIAPSNVSPSGAPRIITRNIRSINRISVNGNALSSLQVGRTSTSKVFYFSKVKLRVPAGSIPSAFIFFLQD